MSGMQRRLGKFSWRTRRFLGKLGYRMMLIRVPSSRAIKPSVTIVTIVVLAFSVFNLAGGVYDLLEKPVSLLPTARAGGWTFLYRGSLNVQTLNESIISALLYGLGLSGLYMLFRSTRFAYRPRNAYLLLMLGFVMTFIVVYYSVSLLNQKIG